MENQKHGGKEYIAAIVRSAHGFEWFVCRSSICYVETVEKVNETGEYEIHRERHDASPISSPRLRETNPRGFRAYGLINLGRLTSFRFA